MKFPLAFICKSKKVVCLDSLMKAGWLRCWETEMLSDCRQNALWHFCRLQALELNKERKWQINSTATMINITANFTESPSEVICKAWKLLPFFFVLAKIRCPQFSLLLTTCTRSMSYTHTCANYPEARQFLRELVLLRNWSLRF